jgi:hypothetical protein
MILSVIASLDSLAAFIDLTSAIELNASYFSLKNFSMLSLSLITLSVDYFVIFSLFSVLADDAESNLSIFPS